MNRKRTLPHVTWVLELRRSVFAVLCVTALLTDEARSDITDGLDGLMRNDPRPVWQPGPGETGQPFPGQVEIVLAPGVERRTSLQYQTHSVRARPANSAVAAAQVSDEDDYVSITGKTAGETRVEITGMVVGYVAGANNAPNVDRPFRINVLVAVRNEVEPGKAGSQSDETTTIPGLKPETTAGVAGTTASDQLERLRREVTAPGSGHTFESVPRLSIEEIEERLKRYRRLVDATVREPFRFGAQPDVALVERVKQWHDTWGEMGEALRTGDPRRLGEPPTVSRERLTKTAASAPDADSGSVRVSGTMWAELSDAYFKATVDLEHVVEDAAAPVRGSPEILELGRLMDEAEATWAEIREMFDNPNEGLSRRRMSWLLYQVRRIGVSLMLGRQAQLQRGQLEEQILDRFLRDSRMFRRIRKHGSLRVAPEGALGSDPPEVVNAPRGATLHAQFGTSEEMATVGPPAPHRLPELAAELYRIHFALKRAERVLAGNDPDAPGPLREPLTPEKRNQAEGFRKSAEETRRILGRLMSEEYDRVFGSGR